MDSIPIDNIKQVDTVILGGGISAVFLGLNFLKKNFDNFCFRK